MGAAIRVLYVDDESTLLEISKLFLEAGGEFVVDTLQSAQDALLLLETERYDAIISDYQMPEMDGIEFLKTLRAAGNTIPFILFTGRGREEIVIQALNHGADFYLQKGGEPRSLYAELAHKIHQSVNRKRSEEALKESEMRFRQVFETLPIGLWLADKNGKLIMGNPAGQKIWGAEPHFGQEEYGAFKAWRMPSREQIRPDDWALAHAVNEGRVTEHELLEIEAFNGIHKHILNWVSPVKNENDEIFGAFVINQDITESEHAIKALHESECRFRAIFNATFEFMALLEPDGNIVVVNETALQFGGFSLADVIHKPFWEILWWTISPEISARLKDAVSRVASGEFVRYEVDVLGKDNRVVTIDFSLKPVRDGSGTITSLVAEGRDISGIKRTEQLLRQQTDAMESAIDGMAILDKNQQYS